MSLITFINSRLQLLTDIAMIKFIMRGIRGGLSQCSGKYAKANNKYLKDYNPDEENSFIFWCDANNEYGWAMAQPLPHSNFRWLSEEEIEKFELNSTSEGGQKGYFLEVDLEYPQHLHHLHNDYPFCPENKIPPGESSKTKKLLATLEDKTNYIIHYVNLKQALQHGLLLKKIHRIIEFSQSCWLQPYIDLNTSKRMVAGNAFEKEFYKLINNSVFGKTMENVDKRVDVRLVNSWESHGKRMGAQALISKLNFHSCSILDEDLTIIQMIRNKVCYNKPIYIGFSVLELSKTLMYDFHYNYMKPKYGENIIMLYTDTDSFVYNIKTDDCYRDIKPDLEARFDTSDFPTDNVHNFHLVNKKVVGKFKDECSGRMIKEFIGIRAKCYCIVKDDDISVKKIKGVKRSVVTNEVMEEDYLHCLNHNSALLKPMGVIRSRAHQVYTQTVNKIALNNTDDKRFYIGNYKTLVWGHKDIKKK